MFWRTSCTNLKIYCDVYAVGLRSGRYLVTARQATEEEGVTK
jgi:hypothetical protein